MCEARGALECKWRGGVVGQPRHKAGQVRSGGVTMTWQHLVTLLLVMAASHLATPEGAAAAAATWKTPSAFVHKQGGDDGSSHAREGTVVHVTDDNSNNNTPRDPQPGSPTLNQQQQQQHQQQQQPASTPALQEHPRGKNTSGGGGSGVVGEAGGHNSSVVDTVLAALVDYSRDPKLWRFVHSVIDELDFSQRASHPPAPTALRPPRPALHVSHPHTHWWETAASVMHGRGQGDSLRWSSGSGSHSRGNASGTTITTTSTTTPAAPTTAAPQVPWLQQLPEEPLVSAERIHNNTSADLLSVTRSDRVNFVKGQPAPSPHFLFHRVFLNNTFDSHTRQPYRRPVLALTAVGKDAAKANIDNFTNTTNHSRNESGHGGGGARELADKYNSLAENSVTPRYSSASSKGKEPSQDGDEEQGGGVSESRDVLSSPRNHHHHNHHHHHRLQTFKSQLKFLQRWEERLWRRTHFRLRHSTEGL